VAPELLKPELTAVQAEAAHIMEAALVDLVILQTQAHLKEVMVVPQLTGLLILVQAEAEVLLL
jgi:hypothetical protein